MGTEIYTKEEKKITAHCTWGDGPDIILDNNGKSYILYDDPDMKDKFIHGISHKGSFDLSLQEAIELRNSLNIAIMNVEKIEKSVNDYFEGEFNEDNVESG